MANFYFDVTEIVSYAKKNDTVTGIQRAQLNIIQFLATAPEKKEKVYCIFYNKKNQAYYQLAPKRNWMQAIGSAEQFLDALKRVDEQHSFIEKIQVNFFLEKYKNKKPYDFFSIKKIAGLPRKGVYILLGSDWFSREVWDFAKKHRDNKGRTVQIVYDLIPIILPVYHKALEKTVFLEWLDFCLSNVSDFVCISKHTASDLKMVSDKKGCVANIRVLPLAHEFSGFGRSDVLHQSGRVESLLNEPYILCVGTIEQRKNNLMLLKAWKRLLGDIPDQLPLLVFAGKRGAGLVDVVDFLSDPDNIEISRYVRVLQKPEDTRLAWLYQNCRFTAYLSHYEGWGLPVGESAWFGKYCIASSATSIPEVCGDLIDYVDPDNLDDLTRVLKRAIVDDAYLADREARIQESPARTWRDVADDLYGMLQARPE